MKTHSYRIAGSLLKIICERIFMVEIFLDYQNGSGNSYNKRCNVHINLTLGRVRVTFLALDKQKLLLILFVYL